MKIMKLLMFVFLIILISGIAWFYSMSYGEKWLVMNKRIAEDFAVALLKGDVNYKTPDRFIDYVVTVEKGYVLFYKHDQPYRVLGYFPESTPAVNNSNIAKFNWEKLEVNWYQIQ